ncbi:hypothetical protein P3W85_00980, partial [Cupriavidus basilensis]
MTCIAVIVARSRLRSTSTGIVSTVSLTARRISWLRRRVIQVGRGQKQGGNPSGQERLVYRHYRRRTPVR